MARGDEGERRETQPGSGRGPSPDLDTERIELDEATRVQVVEKTHPGPPPLGAEESADTHLGRDPRFHSDEMPPPIDRSLEAELEATWNESDRRQSEGFRERLAGARVSAFNEAPTIAVSGTLARVRNFGSGQTIQAGLRFGPYTLLGKRGDPTMIETHLAHADRDGDRRTCWVKRLTPRAISDPAFADAFGRATANYASVHHPRLVALIDSGEIEGVPFVAIEHVDGVSLEEIAAPGELPIWVAVEIVASVAETLAALHGAEPPEAHGELMPRAILIGKDGRLMLADFGFDALERAAQGEPTAPPNKKSELHYRASELSIEARDPAADVFALGMIAAEAVTSSRLGVTAAQAKDASELAAAVKERCAEHKAIPRKLVELIGRMVAAEPDARPSAKEVFRASADLLDAVVPRLTLREHVLRSVFPRSSAPPPPSGQFDVLPTSRPRLEAISSSVVDPADDRGAPLPRIVLTEVRPSAPFEGRSHETLMPETFIRGLVSSSSELDVPADREEVTVNAGSPLFPSTSGEIEPTPVGTSIPEPILAQPPASSSSVELVLPASALPPPPAAASRPQSAQYAWLALAAFLLAALVVVAALLLTPG